MAADTWLADLRQVLIDAGLAAGQVFRFQLPDEPDAAVTVTPYDRDPAPPWQSPRRVQVLVRGAVNDPAGAYRLAEQAHGILWPAGDTPPVFTLDGAPVMVQRHISGPLPLGPDGKTRYRYSLNYLLLAAR